MQNMKELVVESPKKKKKIRHTYLKQWYHSLNYLGFYYTAAFKEWNIMTHSHAKDKTYKEN